MTTFLSPQHDRYRDDRANLEDDLVTIASHIDSADVHATNGTTFPSTPVDGQIFTQTGLASENRFYYDDARGLWLGIDLHQMQFGYSANCAASSYLRTAAGNVIGSAVAGPLIPFPKITFTGYSYTVNAIATGNFEVHVNGTVVSGFTFSHASVTYGLDMAANIDYDGTGASILAVYNDAGGIVANPVVTLYFRRRLAAS